MVLVIDKGPNGPLSDTGRAYFGGYITGDVTATDFGEYKASGNVDATLNHDLAQHLIRLNKIRQAVPALRKGQWTDEGCKSSQGWYRLQACLQGQLCTRSPQWWCYFHRLPSWYLYRLGNR